MYPFSVDTGARISNHSAQRWVRMPLPPERSQARSCVLSVMNIIIYCASQKKAVTKPAGSSQPPKTTTAHSEAGPSNVPGGTTQDAASEPSGAASQPSAKVINVMVRILSLSLYCEAHIGSAPARISQSYYFVHVARMDVVFSLKFQRQDALIYAMHHDIDTIRRHGP